MTHSEFDRDHGDDDRRTAAMAAANRAASLVHEMDDGTARTLVTKWKEEFDAIPKGWKLGSRGSPIDNFVSTPGYPEPAWGQFRQAAFNAQERLGEVVRGASAR